METSFQLELYYRVYDESVVDLVVSATTTYAHHFRIEQQYCCESLDCHADSQLEPMYTHEGRRYPMKLFLSLVVSVIPGAFSFLPKTACFAQLKALHGAPQDSKEMMLSVGMVKAKCKEGTIRIRRGETKEYELIYRVFRPMSLSSMKAAPLIAIHGGPSLPSDYQEPLVDAVPYRSIVLFDQLGCGNSETPEDTDEYSIQLIVDDLEALISKLGIRRFHLYGHSFGGMIAYEFLKRKAEQDKTQEQTGCLSIILSSTPTSIPSIDAEYDRLFQKVKEENPGKTDEQYFELFRRNYMCRTPDTPDPLLRAFDKVGEVWFGFEALPEYECTALDENKSLLPSALIIHGEHDYCTQQCIEKWQEFFPCSRVKLLKGCSHFGLLEDGFTYGEWIDSFCGEYD